MEQKILVNKILSFLEKAGDLALKYQDKLNFTVKTDASIVTEADLTISKMFRENFNEYLSLKNHKLLDEENLPDREDFFSNNCEYLWTLDPIDGTTTYFNGFPLWAIGLSLYKNFKPYMGFIYMPSIKELVYTDGEKSYYVKNVFTENEVKTELVLQHRELTKKSIILQHRLKNYDVNKLVVLDLYSSYVSGFYTLIGKSFASFFNKPMKLWDITATLSICKNIGMCFKNLKNSVEVDDLRSIEVDDNWYLKDVYLMCDGEVFNKIKEELNIQIL